MAEVAEGDTNVSQSDHGNDQKAAKSSPPDLEGQYPACPSWPNGLNDAFGGSERLAKPYTSISFFSDA